MDNDYASPNFSTKMKILSSLNRLSGEQGNSFDSVSVIQICEDCSISRSTFYNHFEDKNAIVRWHSNIAYEMGVDRIGRTLTWQEGHFITTRFLEKYSTLYSMAGSVTDYGGVRPFFFRHRVENLQVTLTQFFNMHITETLDFLIKATASVESAMGNIRYFESPEERIDAREYAELITQAVPHDIYDLLKVPADTSRDDSIILALIGNGV
ncbi:MAG TPA: TetR family transcriptional regulator [Coriobacteriaceae bacterium]|nr:TetR family transcriptional regulator [Coriobacteriaceae bacterium]